MINTNDIYSVINSNLVKNGYWGKDIEEQKNSIDTEIRKYIISRYKILNKDYSDIVKLNELSTFELLKLLGNYIEKSNYNSVIYNFIHYILSLASTIQGHIILWIEEENSSIIDTPQIISENGLWDKLYTSSSDDYIEVFGYVYDIFQNGFMNNLEKNKSFNISKTIK